MFNDINDLQLDTVSIAPYQSRLRNPFVINDLRANSYPQAVESYPQDLDNAL